MGSRANANNKQRAFGAPLSGGLSEEDLAARNEERKAKLANVRDDPLTAKQRPPSDALVASRKAQAEDEEKGESAAEEAGENEGREGKGKGKKRPAPRTPGGVTNPQDMDEYLRRAERGY